ncbi:dnaJ homolog subfamily C member 11 [Lepeophtheirus salmonis]|uniref:dnaJ homolog subfamily C member 11 n=1 Tax=Lepeophtheirus salmonis TaxID=72036 RepID=UPI001AE6508B|nr:dnaJ homolog subfamily C member 11-like [Lepeophtheirus salmonis]XP_040567626.1 dnaJ homolog subfamily C member 11-like [Lepeophtheirus salmonis]XP_040567627.1 dnaJ homolog subfamily C member 11-like [Lepeophtheirus salmonis]
MDWESEGEEFSEEDCLTEYSDGKKESDYYNLLHLRHDASLDEIRGAYKKFSIIYHPDKHTDPSKKEEAQKIFAKLSRAYHVLADPYKRAIYDTIGEKGLAEQDWTLIKRAKTPRDIREEHELFLKRQEARAMLSQTNPSTRINVHVNATDLFERYMYSSKYDPVISEIWPRLQISEVSISKSIQSHLSSRDRVNFGGNVTARGGIGLGSVNAAWTRTYNEGSDHFRLGTTMGEQRVSFDGSWNKRIFGRHYLNFSSALNFNKKGFNPDFKIQFINMLGPKTVAYLSYNAKIELEREDDELLIYEGGDVSAETIHSTKDYRIRAHASLGMNHCSFLIGTTRMYQHHRLELMLRIGSFGAVAEYGVRGKVSRYNTVGATMVVGYPSGVTLRLILVRSTQTYSFPIHLSDEIIIQPILYGTLIPLITWYSVKKFILDPMEKRKKQKLEEEELRKKKDRYEDDKKEAVSVMELMQNRYERIRFEEESKSGLIIERALYGNLVSGDNECIREEVNSLLIDLDAPSVHSDILEVTLPVQCLIEEGSKITFHEGSKSNIPGFFRPLVLDDLNEYSSKINFLIRYRYQNVLHQVLSTDLETFRIPLSSHKL